MRSVSDDVPQIAHPRGLPGRLIARGMALWNSPVYRMVAGHTELSPQDDLLDVGCAAGYFLKRHGAAAKTVAGLDISADMVAEARRLLRGRIALGQADVRQGDGTKIPWEDASFSIVTCMEVLYFVDDVPAFLSEIFRVLRAPGRLLLAVEWNRDETRDHSREAERYKMKLYSAQQIQKWLTDAGFRPDKVVRERGFWSSEGMLLIARKEQASSG